MNLHPWLYHPLQRSWKLGDILVSPCPSVDAMLSALYFPHYSPGPFLHIWSINFRRCVAFRFLNSKYECLPNVLLQAVGPSSWPCLVYIVHQPRLDLRLHCSQPDLVLYLLCQDEPPACHGKIFNNSFDLMPSERNNNTKQLNLVI